MSTPFPSKKTLNREWHVIDAQGQVLGRLATRIATVLMGKHKPGYTPFLDCGDHVVVVNADKIVLTGNKMNDKMYYRYSGYPGGIKEARARRVMRENPTRILESAVRGMVPKTTLGRQMFSKLRVYAGPEHPHEAQQPQPYSLSD
ncbi:MAG TPA: 50S ribosomal protein L13 [Acidobacteriota bacterium]|jgi:large subunit ribosomal protein L13|nr:50S ribosomal protein L13 [Acidobacteriota bacterium]MDP6687185.1 50S ribosomal protein L13 [Acidobacteriota bacterium]HJO29612.1 50S ribosomal protein L13 [Acidobacteriota bacterium]|tara:strand:+ start:11549 stop:11983 length:435 start_codon:yes stop_codon:yes gene_type:complete